MRFKSCTYISMEQVVKMDNLGPIILNSDGTMSRINGWENLTEGERERSLRLIAKRNKARKESLMQAEETQQQQRVEDEGRTDKSITNCSEVLAIEYNHS